MQSLSTTSKKFNSLRKNIYNYISNLADIYSKLIEFDYFENTKMYKILFL